jgi:hypothetical protein
MGLPKAQDEAFQAERFPSDSNEQKPRLCSSTSRVMLLRSGLRPPPARMAPSQHAADRNERRKRAREWLAAKAKTDTFIATKIPDPVIAYPA